MSGRTLNLIGEVIYFFVLSAGSVVSTAFPLSLELSILLYAGTSALDVVSTVLGMKVGKFHESNPIFSKFGLGWKSESIVLLLVFFLAAILSGLYGEDFSRALSRAFVVAASARLGGAANNFFLLQMVRRGRNGS